MTQTDVVEHVEEVVPSTDGKCNCDTKYQKVVSDLKEKLKNTHETEQESALKELSERVGFFSHYVASW
jgi:hypothetical protein